MKPTLLFSLCIAAIPIPAFAADRTAQVSGWTLKDVGGKPGNDLDREVSMERQASGVEIAYKPGPGRSGTVIAKFAGCERSSEFSASLQFKSSADALKSVREEIAYNFTEFRKECTVAPDSEKGVMQGFDEAFQTVTKWVQDKPFVFPPNGSAPSAVPAPGAPGDTI